MDISTRNWVVTTIAGYVLLAIWIGSILTNPIVRLDPVPQGTILVVALGALGLSNISGLTGVKTAAALKQ